MVAIYAGVRGYLDRFPVDAVTKFEHGLLSLIRSQHGEILKEIREKREITKETDEKLKAMMDGYAKTFAA